MTSADKIVDMVELLLRKSGASDKKIYNYLRMFHLFLPTLFLFLILFSNEIVVQYTILVICIIFIMFIAFNGCILSKLERRFCKTNATIIDPLLNFFNIPITYKNRYNYTISINIFCVVMALIIYYIRFI
jgi:preprotein translocase subunit SecE